MPGYTVKRIEDMESIYGGAFKRARAELGVTSFGMQIIDMPPHADRHPEHDHASDGQEEVYVVLRGAADVDIEGKRIAIDPDTLLSVRSGTMRKIRTGSEGARILALGGVPGKAFEPKDFTELGAPDPMAG